MSISLQTSLTQQLLQRATNNLHMTSPEEIAVVGKADYERAVNEGFFDGPDASSVKQFHRHYVLTAYSNIYSRLTLKLQQIIREVDQISSFYLVDVALNQIVDDALAPRMGDEQIFKFSSTDQLVEKTLNDMRETINLDQTIMNIASDLCKYGEYVLSTDIKKDSGVIALYDDLDQGTVISISNNGDTVAYLAMDELRRTVEVKELADYIKFTLGGQRVKVMFDDAMHGMMHSNKQLRDYYKKIPRFLRVGKSEIYPFIGKFKELELLEKMIPAMKINKLSQGNLVALPVPDNFDLEQGLNAARRVEGMVNKKVMVDPTQGEITVEAILSTAGKTRVIPVFGDKGRLDKMDYKSDDADDLFTNTKEIRENILDSVGVPSELIYKSDNLSKTDILKRYAKYLRKLKKLRKALAEGLKTIAEIHLQNKGISYVAKDIEVTFVNTLVEIDNLDKLEHADITFSMLTNAKNFMADLVAEDSPYKDLIDLNKFVIYLESNLKTVGLQDVLKTKEEGGKSINKLDQIGETPGTDLPDAPSTKEVPKANKQQEKYPNIPFKVNMPEKKLRRRV